MASANHAMVSHDTGQQSRSESKREKKRQLVQERLARLYETMGRDRDGQFRAQLQKIQLDVNLINQIDPYAERPLAAIDAHRQELAERHTESRMSRSALDMAGPSLQEFVEKIEDRLEERDFQMATHKREYENKLRQIQIEYDYEIQQAHEEHRALMATIGDRLGNTIAINKQRLSKEKEALEISESAAFLLHPNQFSMANPASPGGLHGKRATRMRKEADDGPHAGEGGKKKKRYHNDDEGSPGPQRRGIDSHSTTLVWQNEQLRSRKASAPAYSIDQLFTDKELAMTHNTAALATREHILRARARSQRNGVSPSASDEDSDTDMAESTHEITSAPAAVSMERQISHATRSTRGVANGANFYENRLVGMEALADFEIPGNLERREAHIPKLPPIVSVPYNKKPMSDNNGPAPLQHDDARDDLAAMAALRELNDTKGIGANLDVPNGGRRILEAVSMAPKDRYVSWLQSDRIDHDMLRDELQLPPLSVPDLREDIVSNGNLVIPAASVIGSAAMSRQSSRGGTAMSRQGSNNRGRRRA